MATLSLSKNTSVEALRKEFNENFGAQIKIYNGNKVAELTDSLGALGLTAEGTFECRSSLTVASFIERMKQNHGLKVKVYTCDEWVAVLDGLTLESAGKVKKNAVKADMESMIAYQRTDKGLQGYEIEAREDGGYTVRKDGVECENTKAAMRDIAGMIGLEYEDAWTTRQFGAKLMKAIKGLAASTPAADNNAAERADAEKAKADAEAAAKAKAAADKAKAELERQKVEAEAAKAELERIKAETAKAQAEAEKAKAAAAAAKAEAEKAKVIDSKPSASTSKWKDGVLPGLFSVGENKKVRFSMGNLQFHPKKYEWRFAEHQWDIIGEDNLKVSPTYDGWIDLFGYGTSGYMGCQPTETSLIEKDYPSGSIAGTKYDWGVYNPISNGGNKEGLWRLLTREEADYLYNKRPFADKLRAEATVNNVKGYIILPDNYYDRRACIPFDATPSGSKTNNYDIELWDKFEESEAVFLPEAGYRDDYFHSVGLGWKKHIEPSGRIWLSDGFIWISGEYERLGSYANCRSYNLTSVRLVQDVK